MPRSLALRFGLVGALTVAPALAMLLATITASSGGTSLRLTALSGESRLYTVLPRDRNAIDSLTPEQVGAAHDVGAVLAETRFLQVTVGGRPRIAQFVAGNYFEALGRPIAKAALQDGVVISEHLRRDLDAAGTDNTIEIGAGLVLPIARVVDDVTSRAFGDDTRTDLWLSRDRLGAAVMGAAVATAMLEREIPPTRFVNVVDRDALVRAHASATAGAPDARFEAGIAGDGHVRFEDRRRVRYGIALAALLLGTAALGICFWASHEHARRARDFAIRRALGGTEARLRLDGLQAGAVASLLVLAATCALWPVARGAVTALGLQPAVPTAAAVAMSAVATIFAFTACGIAVCGRSRPPARSSYWRASAIALQIGAASLALTAAALLVTRMLHAVDLEARASGVIVSVASAEDPVNRPLASALLMRRPSPETIAANLPTDGIGRVAIVDADPLHGGPDATRFLDDAGEILSGATIHRLGVSAGFFQAVPLRVLEGGFDSFGLRGSDSAVVSRSFARRLCGEGTCAGRRFTTELGILPPVVMRWRVAAVVEDLRMAGGRLGHDAAVYLPIGLAPVSDLGIVARNVAPERLAAMLVGVAKLLPAGAAFETQSLADRIRAARGPDFAFVRMLTLLAGVLGSVALTAVFATLASAARRGQGEIGIRLAIGASVARAFSPFVSRVVGSAIVATAVGATLACWLFVIYGGVPIGVRDYFAVGASSALLVIAGVLAVTLVALRPSLRSTPARLVAAAFSIALVDSAFAAESSTQDETGAAGTFSVEIDGPAAHRVVPAQADDVESYPSLYIVDRDFKLVGFTERSDQIVDMLDAGVEIATTKAAAAPDLCQSLRLDAGDRNRCNATIAEAERTIILLSARPCPPCDRAVAAVERAARREKDRVSTRYLIVEHRPALAPRPR